MHDRNGRELKAGDRILIPAVVTGVSPETDYCNLYSAAFYGRKPDGAKESFCINTAITLRANDGDDNADAFVPSTEPQAAA